MAKSSELGCKELTFDEFRCILKRMKGLVANWEYHITVHPSGSMKNIEHNDAEKVEYAKTLYVGRQNPSLDI